MRNHQNFRLRQHTFCMIISGCNIVFNPISYRYLGWKREYCRKQRRDTPIGKYTSIHTIHILTKPCWHINSHVFEWVIWCFACGQRSTFTHNPMIHCLHHTWRLLQARVAISALFTTLNLTSLPFKSETWSAEPHASPTHVDLAENQVHADVPDCSKNGFTKQKIPHSP